MDIPLVSVIIPVYKTEKFLRKCLDSVLNQSYPAWECICVNDGSPDASSEILEEYSRRDSRIRVVNRENGGLSAARNTGMENIGGEYFIFLDSDDFIHPQLLEICVYQALRDSSDMVVYRWSRSYTRLTRLFLKLGLREYRPAMKRFVKEKAPSILTDNIYKYVTDGNKDKLPDVGRKQVVRHCSVCRALYSSELFADIRFRPDTMYEDVLWWGEALMRVRLATINNLDLYHYYPNMSSFTRNVSKLKIRIANLERVIPLAEKLYEDKATDYQKRIWHERFIVPLTRKLDRWKSEAVSE